MYRGKHEKNRSNSMYVCMYVCICLDVYVCGSMV